MEIIFLVLGVIIGILIGINIKHDQNLDKDNNKKE